MVRKFGNCRKLSWKFDGSYSCSLRESPTTRAALWLMEGGAIWCTVEHPVRRWSRLSVLTSSHPFPWFDQNKSHTRRVSQHGSLLILNSSAPRPLSLFTDTWIWIMTRRNVSSLYWHVNIRTYVCKDVHARMYLFHAKDCFLTQARNKWMNE
jgi:hypothetical protein